MIAGTLQFSIEKAGSEGKWMFAVMVVIVAIVALRAILKK